MHLKLLPGIATLLSITLVSAAHCTAIDSALKKPILQKENTSSYLTLLRELEQADQAIDNAWLALESRAALVRRQQQIKAQWLAALGDFPQKTPLNARTTATVKREGYLIEKVLFESQPQHFVTAHLFLPDESQFTAPYPTIVISCGHSREGKALPGYQRAAVLAAKAGFAAFIYDPIDQGERIQLSGPKAPVSVQGHTTTGMSAMLLGWNTARFRIWDGIRAIDYVQSRPELDGARIGIMGNSGGGTLSSYLMAMDERIKAAAPSCYLSSARAVYANVGPQDAEQNIFGQMVFGLNHASYILLRAPLPVCICCNTHDFFPLQGSRETHRIVKEVCARFGWQERQTLIESPGPHGWREGARIGSLEWMGQWLCAQSQLPSRDNERYYNISLNYDEQSVDCGLGVQEAWVVPQGKITELPQMRSVYDLMRDELKAVEAARIKLEASDLPRTVMRLAAIRDISQLHWQRTTVERLESQNTTILREYLKLDSGLRLPAVTLEPATIKAAPVLLLDNLGKSNCCERARELLALGHPVMVPDLTACGEITARQHPHFSAGNGEEEVAVMLYLLGRSLVGSRAEDILICATSLAERYQVSGIIMEAAGGLCVAASHAYAVAPQQFSSIALKQRPLSWSEVVSQGARYSFAMGVHSALRHYDWPELLPAP